MDCKAIFILCNSSPGLVLEGLSLDFPLGLPSQKGLVPLMCISTRREVRKKSRLPVNIVSGDLTLGKNPNVVFCLDGYNNMLSSC
jgi:hypothetical protein